MCLILPLWSQPQLGTLRYEISWRLIRAGTVAIENGQPESKVKIESAGLVSTLYKVDDTYLVRADEHHCTQATSLDAQQGSRHLVTEVKYEQGHARYYERDVVKNTIVRESNIELPACIQDVLTGLGSLRRLHLDPGQSTQILMSDGRRAAQVKVEAQAREDVTTPAGTFHTIRYEAFLLNGVVYQRKGRVFVWMTDDERRVPVQLRMRINFPIGTITLALEKELAP
jgi:Protein of unknown function (DUF3108)